MSFYPTKSYLARTLAGQLTAYNAAAPCGGGDVAAAGHGRRSG